MSESSGREPHARETNPPSSPAVITEASTSARRSQPGILDAAVPVSGSRPVTAATTNGATMPTFVYELRTLIHTDRELTDDELAQIGDTADRYQDAITGDLIDMGNVLATVETHYPYRQVIA